MTDRPDFTPRAHQVLALARKEADRLNHSYVGTEHLLLGLLKLATGGAYSALTGFADREDLERAVLDEMGIPTDQAASPAPAESTKPKTTGVRAVEPWPDPPAEPRYRHFLLHDDSVQWLTAIAKERANPAGESERTQPIDIPTEVDGPFLRNLMAREPVAGSQRFGGQTWTTWSISEAEYGRLARMAALAASVREFNRLAEYSI